MNTTLLSFEELDISANEDIATRIAKHSGQAGSVFRPRGEALRLFKAAEDHVKYLKAKIEMDTLVAGQIPNPTGGAIKITVNSMKAYVESHPDVKQARDVEAKAAMHLDNARAVANCYLDVKDHLKMLQSERLNVWHSDAVVKSSNSTESGGVIDIT